MGAVGENAHAESEYILVAEFVRRTALLVHVLAPPPGEMQPRMWRWGEQRNWTA